jgi:rod shape-determining protein MreC
MSSSLGRVLTRSDTVLLGACLALSVVALVLPSSWAMAFASSVRETALGPLVWLQRNAEEQRTSRVRLRAIAAERDSAALAAQSLAGLQSENAQLRSLLGLKERAHYSIVSGEVLHQASPTDGRTLLLSVGRSSGVEVGSPVVSAEGLLGLVVGTARQSAIVMTWAHPDFAVSAVTEGGGLLGIVSPASGVAASESFLQLRGVPYRDSVAVGTLVLTSGLNGVYPKGLPVGRVAGVWREELGWERVYRLTPIANPGQVTHVLIYLTRGQGRGAGFAGPGAQGGDSTR